MTLCGVQGVRPDQILAITFTNKAAAELKQRLQQAINEAAVSVQARAAGATAVTATGSTHDQQEAFERAWQQLGVLACTFHSYCYRVLRQKWRACGFTRCPLVRVYKDARQAVRLAIRLSQVDGVAKLLAGWLGASEETWPAIQAAARQKHPQIMAKWAGDVLAAKAKALETLTKKKQK
eukprot:GHUV01051808.1.p1 GENE.GHUV01051808.1~~GHUV01051808.1.p1  ORF type:complete len:179 (+),score=64.61 GHUV01051808.1:240-776(+)